MAWVKCLGLGEAWIKQIERFVFRMPFARQSDDTRKTLRAIFPYPFPRHTRNADPSLSLTRIHPRMLQPHSSHPSIRNPHPHRPSKYSSPNARHDALLALVVSGRRALKEGLVSSRRRTQGLSGKQQDGRRGSNRGPAAAASAPSPAAPARGAARCGRDGCLPPAAALAPGLGLGLPCCRPPRPSPSCRCPFQHQQHQQPTTTTRNRQAQQQ
jgi:hypothetical protein